MSSYDVVSSANPASRSCAVQGAVITTDCFLLFAIANLKCWAASSTLAHRGPQRNVAALLLNRMQKPQNHWSQQSGSAADVWLITVCEDGLSPYIPMAAK